MAKSGQEASWKWNGAGSEWDAFNTEMEQWMGAK
jgi:hypothetical protein